MSALLEELQRHVLPFVKKPARYIGSEIGMKRKARASVPLKLALVYPDVYEVGMSNIGLKVLFNIASRFDQILVERAFAPWTDAEKLLRSNCIPLYSLESFTPLREFDLVGITLQTELTYTNVLTVLDLAGIPLRAGERSENDPLVCAGGPCAVNPEVMAPFFDFFVLGDGETAICEITQTLLELGSKGDSRKERLKALGRIEGVYVPGPETPAPGESIIVTRVADLDSQPAPDGLPVPLTELAQDHFAVEIMRGCTCGCRFCQAGMYYRPVRTRSVGRIIETVRKSVRAGGWGTVTLLSLSSADYPEIEELVERLTPELKGSGVRLSFPSLRVSSKTLRLLERLESGKKSGLTFAVEAGSERLRNVIGKKVDEEELINLVTEAFRAGWTLVKLYFMLGLPTETDHDADEIARLIRRVASVAHKIPGKHNINVALSPFVPKPATPFQWETQQAPQLIRSKIERIRRQVRARSVTLKIHNPEMSALEGVLARGDRRISNVVQAAWERGARFDGWSETFAPLVWAEAFKAGGVDRDSYLAARPEGLPAPWHFVRVPVEEAFLSNQRLKASLGENVEDCATGPCLYCGAEEPSVCRALRARKRVKSSARLDKSEPLATGPLPVSAGHPERQLWRVRYAKKGLLRFLGHLDTVRGIEFMLRRTGVPVCYGGLFSPRMRLHFSPPLPLGAESRAEYFDFETLTVERTGLHEALEKASRDFEGFSIMALKALPTERKNKLPHLAADIICCRYCAVIPEELLPKGIDWIELVEACRTRHLEEGAFHYRTDKKGRRKKIHLAEALESVKAESGDRASLTFVLDLQGENICRPDRFLGYLLELNPSQTAICRIEKQEAFVRRGEELVTPLDF